MAGSGDPVAFTGVAPRSLSELRVTVDPTASQLENLIPGDRVPEHTLDSSSIEISGGRYTVRVDPAELPAGVLNRSGLAGFNVIGAEKDGGAWITSVSARALVDESGSAVWVEPESAPAIEAVTLGAVVEIGGRVLPKAALEGHGHLEVVQAARMVHTETTSGESQSGEVAPQGGGCPTTLVDRKRVWATIGTSYPLGASDAYMDVNSSMGATYGVAVSANGSYGSWSNSSTKTIEGGWGFQWNPSPDGVGRSYRKEVEYGKYRVSNGIVFPYCQWVYQWRPIVETGGTDSYDGLTRNYDWQTCASRVNAGTWTRFRSDGSAYTYGASVKFKTVIGIDLSIKRQYSSNQKIVYRIVGPSPKTMCGNGRYPSLSGKQIERWG